MDTINGRRFDKIIIDDLNETQRQFYKSRLHALAYGANIHKTMATVVAEASDMTLTRKEAINAYLDMAVIVGELMNEIDELNANLEMSRRVVKEKDQLIRDMEIRHAGFVEGLSHGFKLEAGDV